MQSFKPYEATGLAPNGRLYAGDLNLFQALVAALSDFTQTIDVNALRVGETGLQLLFYGSGEARLSGSLRTDKILRGLGGLFAGAYTTAQRDAIASGQRPFTLIVFNTNTNQFEWNAGTDASPNWQPVSARTSDELSYQDFTQQVIVDSSEKIIVSEPSSRAYDGSTPVEIRFFAPYAGGTSSSVRVSLYDIVNGGSAQAIGILYSYQNANANADFGPVTASRFITPSAGTHRFSIRASNTGGANYQFYAGNGGPDNWVPGFIQISKR